MNMIEKLELLMQRGWNIGIECKGKGRTYEMTYEASASKVIGEDATNLEILKNVHNLAHSVGNTLDELIDALTLQIDRIEGKK